MRMDKATDTHVLVSMRELWVGGRMMQMMKSTCAKMGVVKFQE